ncbi:hypothetical protein NQZ68_011181 [Dissostichus eleginoides]|nr:hypothetical protein NQZ68_011181 [Dissostichus eleginoides]
MADGSVRSTRVHSAFAPSFDGLSNRKYETIAPGARSITPPLKPKLKQIAEVKH